MAVWLEVMNKFHDMSGIKRAELYLWENVNGCFYPTVKLSITLQVSTANGATHQIECPVGTTFASVRSYFFKKGFRTVEEEATTRGTALYMISKRTTSIRRVHFHYIRSF